MRLLIVVGHAAHGRAAVPFFRVGQVPTIHRRPGAMPQGSLIVVVVFYRRRRRRPQRVGPSRTRHSVGLRFHDQGPCLSSITISVLRVNLWKNYLTFLHVSKSRISKSSPQLLQRQVANTCLWRILLNAWTDLLGRSVSYAPPIRSKPSRATMVVGGFQPMK